MLTGMYDMKLQEIYTYSLADRTMNQVSRFNQEVLEDKYVAEPEPVAFTLNGVEPVSYTHLDVYKRQILWTLSTRLT